MKIQNIKVYFFWEINQIKCCLINFDKKDLIFCRKFSMQNV